MNAPLLLGLDTSGGPVSVGLMDTALRAERTLHVGLTHSETLMPMVEGLLQDANTTLSHVEGVAVAVGPGSFTGLRIGIAAVKALAWAAGKPLIPVGTLPGLAAQAWAFDGLVAPVMDARRGQVYTAVYRGLSHEVPADLQPVGFSCMQTVLPPCAITARELVEHLATFDAPVMLLGDGVTPNAEVWSALPHVRSMPPGQSLQRAASLLQVAHWRWAVSPAPQSDPAFDALQLDAVYLRASQAERKLRGEEGA